MRAQMLGAVGQRGLLELIGGHALERIGEIAQRFGDRRIEHSVRVGDVGLGTHRAELELVAREGEGARAVAVGVVALKIGQHHGAQIDDARRGVDARLAVHDHLDDLGELVAQEDRHDRRRGLVGAETVVVAAAGDAGAQEVLVLVHGLDHGGEEDDELQVLQRRVAGLEQVLVGGAERPVVVLAASVDALERLLVQEAHEVVAACDELHLLHHEQVVIHRGVELRVYGRELMLAGGDLVVLGLGRNAQ